MTLRDQFESSGSWLFRYRSYVPLVIIPFVVPSMLSFTYWNGSHSRTEWWQLFCLLVSLGGFAVRIVTVGYVPHGTSGRNARQQTADSLNTTGMYSVVRHPLYLGNYFIFIGFVLFFRSWAITLLLTCLYCIYYERIMFAEEHFLRKKFGDAFETWAASTPAFIPRWRQWKSPDLPFSIRSVLSREYSGFFLITTVFALLDEFADSHFEHKCVIDWLWIAVFFVGLVVYVVLRTVKKRTSYLSVPGR